MHQKLYEKGRSENLRFAKEKKLDTGQVTGLEHRDGNWTKSGSGRCPLQTGDKQFFLEAAFTL